MHETVSAVRCLGIAHIARRTASTRHAARSLRFPESEKVATFRANVSLLESYSALCGGRSVWLTRTCAAWRWPRVGESLSSSSHGVPEPVEYTEPPCDMAELDPRWCICGGTPEEGEKGVVRLPIRVDGLSVPWLVDGCGGLSVDCHTHIHTHTHTHTHTPFVNTGRSKVFTLAVDL